MKKIMNSFLNENSLDFLEYFEIHRQNNLVKREDYKKNTDEIRMISLEYPNAIDFIESGETGELNDQELQAAYDILKLKGNIDVIEIKEAFKLGFKEAIIYFQEMGMLNIKKNT